MKNPETFIKRWKFGNNYKHLFEVGPMLFSKPYHTVNYFMMRICSKRINWKNYHEFYGFHLDHYNKNTPNAKESDFFKFIAIEVNNAIEAYKLDRFNSRANVIKYKLQDFYEFLKTRDEWRICEYGQDEKDNKIASLQLDLSRLKPLDIPSNYKIDLTKMGLTTFADLLIQIQELADDDGNPYFPKTTQASWAKIISLLCSENKQDIKQDKIYDYFKLDGEPIGNKLSRKRNIKKLTKNFTITVKN